MATTGKKKRVLVTVKKKRRVSAAAARSRKEAAQVPRFEVRELDPILKCGPETSVQFLYRVIERRPEHPVMNHLVYFDQHGWYCEHGRGCAAVAPAKRESPAMARAS